MFKKIVSSIRRHSRELAVAGTAFSLTLATALPAFADDFGIGDMALDLAPLTALIAIVIPGLFLLWVIRKVIKTSNRS